MTCSLARFSSKKAQLKIQEMAFVLVALMILFALVAIFYLTYTLSNLKETANAQKQAEAVEIVRKLSTTPELSWTASSTCTSCIDADKALVLKDRKSYSGFWNLDYFAIELVAPARTPGECTKANYPDCTTFTIINSSQIGTPVGAFVALCRIEFSQRGYPRCELARVFASGKGVFNEK